MLKGVVNCGTDSCGICSDKPRGDAELQNFETLSKQHSCPVADEENWNYGNCLDQYDNDGDGGADYNDPEKWCWESSPIVLDLDDNGYHLVGPDPGVSFDLLANGLPQVYGWTAPGANDAFLARDLNGNGVIDNGEELFGTTTKLLAGGCAKNGFEVLAELDLVANGGNSNGRVDSADSGWQSLILWIDLNHDGRSQLDELIAPSVVGLSGISFDVHQSGRQDQWGNRFRWRSKCYFLNRLGHEIPRDCYDIVFARGILR